MGGSQNPTGDSAFCGRLGEKKNGLAVFGGDAGKTKYSPNHGGHGLHPDRGVGVRDLPPGEQADRTRRVR